VITVIPRHLDKPYAEMKDCIIGTFKLAPSDPTDRYNYFVLVAILLGLLLLSIFVPALMQSHAGEVAAYLTRPASLRDGF
jgi:hypothetical protein